MPDRETANLRLLKTSCIRSMTIETSKRREAAQHQPYTSVAIYMPKTLNKYKIRQHVSREI